MATIVVPVNESLQTAEDVLKESAIASVVEALADVHSESNPGRSPTASHTSTLRCNVQSPLPWWACPASCPVIVRTSKSS